jgi:hypothetical protein
MDIIFGNDTVKVRRLQDCSNDYNLFVKWLSDLGVCEH